MDGCHSHLRPPWTGFGRTFWTLTGSFARLPRDAARVPDPSFGGLSFGGSTSVTGAGFRL